MASTSTNDIDSPDKLYPAVAMYGPKNIKGLKKDEVKMWCACGLSKKQPWCDGSHIGTGIKPLKWKVPNTQTLYQLCVCKYTKSPPYCDGTHTNLPSVVSERVTNCSRTPSHRDDCKLCTGCGWVPDF